MVGVYAPGLPVAHLTALGLHALQHRGQESAGIAVSDGSQLTLHKRLGLVGQVFDEETLTRLEADQEGAYDGHAARLAIGHTRYSTTGSNSLPNVQPVYASSELGELMLGHNGNLTNADLAARRADRAGDRVRDRQRHRGARQAHRARPGAQLGAAGRAGLPSRLGCVHLHDAHRQRAGGGARPGRLPAAGARPAARRRRAAGRLGGRLGERRARRDGCHLRARRRGGRDPDHRRRGRPRVAPGVSAEASDARERLCVFEFVYLARPDSVIGGRLLYEARLRMGRRLAIEQPADADLVIPVPDSAIPAAIGYAEQSGLPFREGLIKNRYVGRTFIQPGQTSREASVRLKFNPLPEVLAGKRVVVVDDSIVRGTTTGPIVAMLRRAGAREVHVRIHSPQMKYPCYMGVDTGRRAELIAANLSLDGIRQQIGADTLGYLSQEGLLAAVGGDERRHCTACFDGSYPVDVPLDVDKFALERG